MCSSDLCFSVVNMTIPNDAQMRRIFSTLLTFKLSEFSDEIKPLADPLTQACIEVYNTIAEQLLPTPSKMHYLFNTRDLAKVVQGVMQAHPKFYDSREAILQLWCHETFRIYGDRMWDHNDKEWLKARAPARHLVLFLRFCVVVALFFSPLLKLTSPSPLPSSLPLATMTEPAGPEAVWHLHVGLEVHF